MKWQASRVLAEAFAVSVVGLLVALTANYFSPVGLSLTRDYFPVTPGLRALPGAGASVDGTPSIGAGTNQQAEPAPAVAGNETGIAKLTTTEALKLYHDPEYEQELIVFVDARDTRHFEEGHIPGAYQLDRYHPEKHLPTVLPACLNATRVVVYCTGGDCEDSHYAAQALQEAGVPGERLSVYTGGITEWEAGRLPIETGARKSGDLRAAKP